MGRKRTKYKTNKKPPPKRQQHIPDNPAFIEEKEKSDDSWNATDQKIKTKFPECDNSKNRITVNQYRANIIMTGIQQKVYASLG